MSDRSFGAYTYKQKLRIGFCGDAYRACAPDGSEVRILHVSPKLSADRTFSSAVLKYGGGLRMFDHDNVVRTREVGRATDGSLVVVSDAVPGRVDVAELLEEAGSSTLPHDVAAAIGYQFLHGLAAAHTAGIVHGAVHPRCVVVDVRGAVKVADFAIGRALAVAGAGNPGSALATEVGPYLPHEVFQGGQRPSREADVYAAAAVIYHMLSGGLPPGTLDISPGFERMIQRALDADPSRRYADAGELFENFAEALEDDSWLRATPDELSTHVMEAQSRLQADLDEPSAQAALDEATEDLLSILGDEPPVPEPVVGLDPNDETFDGLGDPSGPDEMTVEAAAHPPDTLDGAISALEADQTGDFPRAFSSVESAELDPPTAVDAPPPLADSPDPISELIALTGVNPRPPGLLLPRERFDSTGDPGGSGSQFAAPPRTAVSEPAESAAEQGDIRFDSTELAVESEAIAEPEGATFEAVSPDPGAAARNTAEPTSEPQPTDAEPAAPARTSGDVEDAPRGRAKPDPSDLELAEALAGMSLQKRSPLRGVLWVGLAIAAIGVLVWIVQNQRELREDAARRALEKQRADQAALAAHRASQPKSGTVVIESEPGDGAVWLKLGRTPAVSPQVSTAQLHELRFELDGHETHDIRVEAALWQGADKDDRRADVKVALTPGSDDKPAPAYPPEPPASARVGFSEGKGHIHIESTPPGAEVWLLVGITPSVKYEGEAGVSYEFKVVKDGYTPGFVEIKAEDWPKGENRLSRTARLAPRGSVGR